MKRSLAGALSVAVAAVLAGCSSAPVTRYHTLLPVPQRGAAGPAAPVLRWELLPVRIVAQVDRPQWVLQGDDGSLIVLEHERWIAPVADELGAALTQVLGWRFGPPSPGAAKAWRVSVELQRLDSVPGRLARLDALWSLHGPAGPALRCAVRLEQAAPGGLDDLAAAHRRSVIELGERIGDALSALDAGPGAACPTSPGRTTTPTAQPRPARAGRQRRRRAR